MHDLGILVLIWLSVFVAAYLSHKTRLTPVLWYLFCGAVMVNTGILPLQMPEFIINFAELGIIIIMFALGFEEDSSNFIKSIKRSWGIAFFGALVPFSIAYTSTYYWWGDTNMALLCGLAMTATAVSLTLVSLKTEGLARTQAATGIMTSAVLDDIASLAAVAIMVPIAAGTASLSVEGVLLIVGKAVAFFVLVTFIGAWLFPSDKPFIKNIPFLGKFHLSLFLKMGKGDYTILSLLLVAVLVGMLAHEFGFHPAVGAYMAGLIIHREYFDDVDGDQEVISAYRKTRTMIDNIAFSWIGPVFFVVLGTKLVFESELFFAVLPEGIFLFVALFIGQIASAGLAAYYTGKFDKPSSVMIGFGMLGRAELAFVVMDIAFAQYGIITREAFYVLMITVTCLNISVPLTIRWWKNYYKDYVAELKAKESG